MDLQTISMNNDRDMIQYKTIGVEAINDIQSFLLGSNIMSRMFCELYN